MQFKKQEVKDKIVDSAKSLFIKNGYEKTSMQEIATVSGITPGNIYRYFNGKLTLLEYIIKPIESCFESYLASDQTGDGAKNLHAVLEDLADRITDLCEKYGDGLNIFFNCTGEAGYNGLKEKILQKLSGRILQVSSRADVMDSYMNDTIASSILGGIFRLIGRYYRQTDELESQLRLYVGLMCRDFDQRLASIGHKSMAE